MPNKAVLAQDLKLKALYDQPMHWVSHCILPVENSVCSVRGPLGLTLKKVLLSLKVHSGE